MSSYRLAAKDPELALRLQLRNRELPEKHWCRGCFWAKIEPPVFVCPFIEGSCAKLPETINRPDPELLRQKMREVRRRAAQEDEEQRAKEGRMTAVGERMTQRKKTTRGELYILDGQVHTLPEWAAQAGMSDTTLRKRLKKGMSLQEALKHPVMKQCDTRSLDALKRRGLEPEQPHTHNSKPYHSETR